MAIIRPRCPVRGFTIVEMVMVIVIVGIIFAIGGMVMGKAFQSYDLAQRSTDTDWQGRVALERMAREMRDIRTATAADLAFSATDIRFIDVDGNTVCYRLNGTTLQRGVDAPASVCGTIVASLQPLADNVGSLNFNFYQQDGTVAGVATQVFYITVRVQVTEGNVTETYRVTVQPRRF